MSAEIAKNSIRTLLYDAVAMAVGQQLPITELRGIALFDPRRDARLTDLASFAAAAPAIITIPNFETRYGGDEVYGFSCSSFTNILSTAVIFVSMRLRLRVCGGIF